MSEFVALSDMVEASEGSLMYPPAVSGTWTAGVINTTEVNYLSVDGSKAIKEAECTFTFVGLDGGGAPVNGSSKVTLSAGSTVLRDSSDSLLVLNNFSTDTYGNMLTIISGQTKLKTS